MLKIISVKAEELKSFFTCVLPARAVLLPFILHLWSSILREELCDRHFIKGTGGERDVFCAANECLYKRFFAFVKFYIMCKVGNFLLCFAAGQF